MKTIKQVERQESSEEEELSTSAQDEQESDSEDFPPGAPEVKIRCPEFHIRKCIV